MLEDKIQNPGECLFRFSIGGSVMDQRSGEVDSVDELTSSRSVSAKNFPNFELLDARSASALNKNIQNSHFKKRRSVWRNWKLGKRTGFHEEDISLTWSTTPFELLVLMIPFFTMRIYSPSVFEAMMFRTSIRGGMKFYNLWPRSQWMMFWKVCTNWEYVSLTDQLKTVLGIVRQGNSSKFMDAQLSKIEDDGEKKQRSGTSITKFRRQKRETWGRSSGSESQGIKEHWKRKRSLLSVQSKRTVFERRPVQFPTRQSCSFRDEGHERAKPTPKPLHPLSHQHQEVEARREKGASEAGARLGRPIDSRANTSWDVLSLNYLVTIGILPNVNSF